jgi:serine-type D-Ala-D-Ala carboxypeptidase (penicillin-binding protein 5/6)
VALRRKGLVALIALVVSVTAWVAPAGASPNGAPADVARPTPARAGAALLSAAPTTKAQDATRPGLEVPTGTVPTSSSTTRTAHPGKPAKKGVVNNGAPTGEIPVSTLPPIRVLSSRASTSRASVTVPKAPTTTVRATTTVPTTAAPAPGDMPAAKSYVLVDENTGNVLAGHDERLRLPPASLTKVLTALIAYTYLPPDARVAGTTVSEAVYPNRVGIEVGVAWPLDEILQSLLVLSANDAAYAIADRISGTLRAFAPVMDRSAQQIGMSDNPQFHDPAGLDGTEGFDGGNLVSARDLAIAGRDLLHVPELAKIVREQSDRFVDPKGQVHWLPSMNFDFLADYSGAVGVKTGFTDRAGVCIMAAATRDNRTMLAVVMNGYNPGQTAMDLLDQGFATPVSGEPTADRLPPVALPKPPKATPKVIAPPREVAKSGCGSKKGTAACPHKPAPAVNRKEA